MSKITYHKISLKRLLSFFALTAFFTTVLNLPSMFSLGSASAAATAAYNVVSLTNQEIGVGATNFKVMEFSIPDNGSGTQDLLVVDGSVSTKDGDTLVPMSDVSNLMYIEHGGGTGFSSGDDLVLDNDGDGVFTPGEDFLVDADGTATPSFGTISGYQSGDDLFDIDENDHILADSISKNSVTRVWHDVDQDGAYTGNADEAVLGDAPGLGAGSIFAPFTNTSNSDLHYAPADALIDEAADLDGLWLDDGDGEYNDSRFATATGAAVFPGFTVDATNNALVINVDGGATGDETINLAEATYTSAELVNELDQKLEAATDLAGADDVTVAYGADGKFTITNNYSEDITLKWSDANTTAEALFGFAAEDDVLVAAQAATPATGTITVTAGDALDTYTVTIGAVTGNAVAFDTDYNTTATNIATDITDNMAGYTAVAVDAVITITAEVAGTVGNADISVAVTDDGAEAPATTDTEMTGGTDEVEAGTSVSDNSVNIVVVDDTHNTLTLEYSFYDGLNGVSKVKGVDVVVANDTYTDIATLVTAVDAGITASDLNGKVEVSNNAGKLVLTSTEKGYGVAVNVTGGNAASNLGLETPTLVGGGDTLVYSDGLTTTTAGTAVISSSANRLVYVDDSTSATGFQKGEYIYVNFGGYTYGNTADVLILNINNDITEGLTGIDVADTEGWVKQFDRAYAPGDDIFIESVAGEFTYSDTQADELIINGSLGTATGGATLVAFDPETKFVDSDGDSNYDYGEDIYKDTGAVSGKVDYEALNAITINNAAASNPVAMSNLTSVRLFYEENTGSPSFGGTEKYVSLNALANSYWSANNLNIQIPDTNGLKVYIVVNVSSSVTEGQKLMFQINELSDANSDGAYQSGDRGIFVSTTDDGPTGEALVSSVVTISAFGTLLDDLESKIDDFQEEIEDVMKNSDDDKFDDYNDDIKDAIDELESLLGKTIDSDSDVVKIFDELNTIVDKMESLVGLIPTSGDDEIDDDDFEDISDSFEEFEDSINAMVSTLGDVVETAQEDKYDDEEDDFDDNKDSLREKLRAKNPGSDDLSGVVDYAEDVLDELDDVLKGDVDKIADEDDLEDLFDKATDEIKDLIDEINELDDDEEYDEDDEDDLEDFIDDIENKADDIISAVETKITAVDSANKNDDLEDEYGDEEYDDDVESAVDDLKDAFDSMGGSVSSEADSELDEILDNLDDIIDEIEEVQDDVDKVSDANKLDDYFDDLSKQIDDTADEIGDAPCAISDDDKDDLEDAIDDVEDAVDDALEALESALNTAGIWTTLESDFDDAKEDLDEDWDDVDDEYDEIDELEGRCEDTDITGPATIVLVSDSYTLLVDETGVETAEITASVRNAAGDLLDNRMVTFEISSPLSNQGSISPVSVRTNSSGQVKTEYTPSQKTSGSVTIKALSANNNSVHGTVKLDVFNNMDGSKNTSSNNDSKTNSDKDDEKEDNNSSSSTTDDKDDEKSDTGGSSETDNSSKDNKSTTPSGEAAKVSVTNKTFSPATGGIFEIEVTEDDGTPVKNEVVTISFRDKNNKVTTYSANTGSNGVAEVKIPNTEIIPGAEYAAIASAGAATSGLQTFAAASSTDNTGSDGQVLGETISVDPATSGTTTSGSGASASLPKTGNIPLMSFAFSAVGSMLLVFRRKEEN
jgi:predicted  nucleic acid-binding Zn-ribbon protein